MASSDTKTESKPIKLNEVQWTSPFGSLSFETAAVIHDITRHVYDEEWKHYDPKPLKPSESSKNVIVVELERNRQQ